MEDKIRERLDAGQHGEAFGMLVEQFKEKVFRLAFSMVQNQAQAEDLAQEVFLKIWRHLASYRSGASLSSWIYAITRNTCLTELKKRARYPTLSLQQPEMEQAADSIPALQSTDRPSGMDMDVQTMLAELPPKYRQVITLYYLEQRSYEEAALLLALPIGTVKTLLFRARKQLLRLASRMGQGRGSLPRAISAGAQQT
jgi:RNA polymerase sigma-70 factor, ECF subfamily